MLKDIIRVLRNRKEIAFAYLYGSVARGSENKESDVDIAVFLKYSKALNNPMYESSLALELEKELKNKKEVDVRILNDKPIVFIYQVLKYGKRIFTRDNKSAVNFEVAALDKYFDFKPFVEAYNRAQSRRLLS